MSVTTNVWMKPPFAVNHCARPDRPRRIRAADHPSRRRCGSECCCERLSTGRADAAGPRPLWVRAARDQSARHNVSERALRPSVIQRKVTNGYRAKWAADAEADLRTTVDTARLSGTNPFNTILAAVSA